MVKIATSEVIPEGLISNNPPVPHTKAKKVKSHIIKQNQSEIEELSLSEAKSFLDLEDNTIGEMQVAKSTKQKQQKQTKPLPPVVEKARQMKVDADRKKMFAELEKDKMIAQVQL
jgi:hypothetical protein